MTNLSFGIVLIVFGLVGVVTLISAIRRRKEIDSSSWFILLCISNLGWLLCYLLYYLIPGQGIALFFHDIRYAFICSSSILNYLFVFITFKHRVFPKRMLHYIFCIPLATFILAATNAWHGLIHSPPVIDVVNGLKIIHFQYGFWFYAHTLASYLPMFFTVTMIIGEYRRLRHNYRSAVMIMLVCVLAAFIATALSVLDLIPYSVDITPCILQISVAIFFISIFHSHSLDMIFTSRDAMFERAAQAIFVLDPSDLILDYNQSAANMAREAGIAQLRNYAFSDFLSQWMARYHGRYFPDDPSILTISRNQTEDHYQITRSSLKNRHQIHIGYYVEIKTITPIMSLIHRLQEMALFDQLTGLPNRHSFTRHMHNLENDAGALPLGIVVGDINHLKRINDKYGHLVGDQLLTEVTRILRESAPANMFWFRMGGDEFVGLLPNTSENEMNALVNATEQRCRFSGHPQWNDASIALSFCLRTHLSQDIYQLIHEADIAMYSKKYERRHKRLD